ncbi:MAG: hypothetical protein ACXU84_16820 [Xanthobacteraceae bacterium]
MSAFSSSCGVELLAWIAGSPKRRPVIAAQASGKSKEIGAPAGAFAMDRRQAARRNQTGFGALATEAARCTGPLPSIKLDADVPDQ